MPRRPERSSLALASLHALAAAVAALLGARALAENGGALWNGDVAVTAAPWDQAETFLSPAGVPALALVTDGEGGAIVAWDDEYGGNVSAQRVAADGSLRWKGRAPSGLAVAQGPWLQWIPQAVSDGAGGAVIAWIDGRNGTCGPSFYASCDVFAQRLDALGRPIWSAEGVAIVTQHRNQGTTGVALVPDGTGGAIVAWYDSRDSATGIYAQRIGGDGETLWEEGGIQVAPAYAGHRVRLVSDGAGGAIAAWTQSDTPADSIRVRRIGGDGTLHWDPAGVEVGRLGFDESIDLIGDGAGGAIIAYATFREELLRVFAQRVDAGGDLLWLGGRAVSEVPTHQNGPQVASDGQGGAILVWQEGLFCRLDWECDVFAQRLGADGAMRWATTGVPVSAGPADEHAPRLVADGSGGVIVVWNDCRHHPASCPLEDMDLFAQRLDGDGQPLWADGGIPASVAPGSQGMLAAARELPSSVALVEDGAHGAILAWPDGRKTGLCSVTAVESDCDVYAQRVPEPSPDLLRFAALAALVALGVGTAASRNRSSSTRDDTERRRASPTGFEPVSRP